MRVLNSLLLAVTLAMATPVSADTGRGLAKAVHRRVLANGLEVLVLQDSSIPTAALYTFFRVGSRNEVPGRTGLAHFFEHMMFNGSEKYGPGEFDRIMEAAGGSNNAFTTKDITVYMDWFPSKALATVLELEADRIGHLSIDPKMVKSERQVVLQERRLRTDGSPMGAMDELFYATAYMAHPYRWPVIGWESDIAAWTRDDLEQFHRTYYAPNDAVMVLVGDVEPDAALDQIERAMGGIPRGPEPEPVRTVEPRQRGERRAVLEYETQLPAIQIGYHVPRSADESAAVMKVVETILLAGQSSRLYRRLVDQDRSALSVTGGYGEWSFDPTLFEITAQLKSKVDPKEVEAAIYEELERLAGHAPEARELRKAKNMILADLYRSMKTISGKARLIGIFEIFHGSVAALDQWDDRIEAVTADQVSEFVRRYMIPTNRTVVTLVPKVHQGGER